MMDSGVVDLGGGNDLAERHSVKTTRCEQMLRNVHDPAPCDVTRPAWPLPRWFNRLWSDLCHHRGDSAAAPLRLGARGTSAEAGCEDIDEVVACQRSHHLIGSVGVL